jgi:hypothetical protein
MVNGKVPFEEPGPVARVSVVEPDVSEGDWNIAVTPDGSPIAFSETLPEKPPMGVTLTE